jgi:hypothetical protein
MLTAAISALHKGLTNPISNKAYPFKKLEQHYSILKTWKIMKLIDLYPAKHPVLF